VSAYLKAIGERGYRPSLLISEERLELLKKTYGEGFVVLGPAQGIRKRDILFSES
jgi:hypothetical protein